MEKNLLPSGFYDLLFPDASKKSHINREITDSFMSYGYQLIDPPMAEFEDSLFADDNSDIALQSYRLPDPMSNKMLGIRSDITCLLYTSDAADES